MYMFDIKDIVKMQAGEAIDKFGTVIDVAVDEKNDTIYIVNELDTDNFYVMLGKDLKLIKR